MSSYHRWSKGVRLFRLKPCGGQSKLQLLPDDKPDREDHRYQPTAIQSDWCQIQLSRQGGLLCGFNNIWCRASAHISI